MAKSKLCILVLGGGLMLLGGTACSNSDNELSSETHSTEQDVKTRHLTITQTTDSTASASVALARAMLTQSGTSLSASWTAGDQLSYCNMSQPLVKVYDAELGDLVDKPKTGNLTAVTSAAVSQFTGDVICQTGDYLAVVYPQVTFTDTEHFTIPLTGQDGTLSTIATRYHYVYGKAQVESVTDATAKGNIGKMKSLLTLCKFKFINKANNDPIPIRMLSIDYNTIDSKNGKYPQKVLVNIKDGSTIKESSAVHATASDISAPLVITSSSQLDEVYVVLVPTDENATYEPIQFTVTNDAGTYVGTAKAVIREGEFVQATLKLTLQ